MMRELTIRKRDDCDFNMCNRVLRHVLYRDVFLATEFGVLGGVQDCTLVGWLLMWLE